MNLAGYLRSKGLKVREVDGWETRGRPYTFKPEGVMVHHTAGTNSLGICTNGRSGLPGPLCHFLIHKNGTIYLIAQGYANGSGKGSSKVLSDVRRNVAPSGDARARGLSNDIYGNRYFWNIEVENLGNGRDPYPQTQIDSLVGLCKALCDKFGWSTNRIVHHREWTDRKIDMSYRGDVRKMAREWVPSESSSSCDEQVFSNGDSGFCVRELQSELKKHGYDITVDGAFGPLTEQEVREFQEDKSLVVDGVVGPNTWRELRKDKEVDHESKILRRGSRGESVAYLRQKLRDVGINVSDNESFTSSLENVVRKFQRSRGIGVDGVVGPNTWRELNKTYDLSVCVIYKDPYYAGMGMVLAAAKGWPILHERTSKSIRKAYAVGDASSNAYDVITINESSQRRTAKSILKRI